MQPTIFLDFNLPNSATWLYFSLILSIALFFQFGRLLSVRNLDLLTLFLMAPGFLLLQEAHALLSKAEKVSAAAPGHSLRDESLAAIAFFSAGGPGVISGATRQDAGFAAQEKMAATAREAAALNERGKREVFFGYAWLIVGSAYWFGRAMVDLALVRRPVMSPNLNTTGLGWLGLALVFCLTAVAVRRTTEPFVAGPVGHRPISIEQFQDGAAAVVREAQAGAGEAWSAETPVQVQRVLAVVCHLAVVVGLLMIGLRHFQDLTTGMALGTIYLLVPYTAFHIAQFHLVWPAAFVTWAIFCYRRPVISGWLLGLAGGSAFVPLLLFPLWVGFYARRGAVRFAMAYLLAVGLSFGVTALLLWWEGWFSAGVVPPGLLDWLPWRRSEAESIWTGAHWAYRLPVFVLYVGFLGAIALWPSPKNLSHLVSLSAAVLIGVQFWHADRGGVYVLWYLPLILMMTFRPTLIGHEPPVMEASEGRMLRWAGAAWRRVRPSRGDGATNELAV